MNAGENSGAWVQIFHPDSMESLRMYMDARANLNETIEALDEALMDRDALENERDVETGLRNISQELLNPIAAQVQGLENDRDQAQADVIQQLTALNLCNVEIAAAQVLNTYENGVADALENGLNNEEILTVSTSYEMEFVIANLNNHLNGQPRRIQIFPFISEPERIRIRFLAETNGFQVVEYNQ